MNPTVDGMMAAMGWVRDADRTAEEVAVYVETYDIANHTPPYMRASLDRLAPRWRVPAIRRRQAANRRARCEIVARAAEMARRRG